MRNLFARLLHQEACIATSECYSTNLRGKNAATTEMLFVCLFEMQLFGLQSVKLLGTFSSFCLP